MIHRFIPIAFLNSKTRELFCALDPIKMNKIQIEKFKNAYYVWLDCH